MKIVSLIEAKQQGLKRFFTGKPCKHGHLSERTVTNRVCIFCAKIRDHKNRLRFKQKNKTRHQEWYLSKKQKSPLFFMWQSAKKRSKQKGLEFNLTVEYLESIFPKDNKCPALKIELRFNSQLTGDDSPALDRLNPLEGYVVNNVAIISVRANRIKQAETEPKSLRMVADWMQSTLQTN